MKNLSLVFALVLVFGVSISAKAGNDNDKDKSAKHDVKVVIPKHTSIGLSSDATITLSPSAPESAGQGLRFDVASASDNSHWLQYSSITSSANSISVSMTSNGQALPNGVVIELQAGSNANAGKGEAGSPKPAIVLNGGQQEIISNIGSCYTGTGSNAGHQLTYTLKMTNADQYSQLASGEFKNTITYTITEN